MSVSPLPTDARVLRDVAVGGAIGAVLRAACLAVVAAAGMSELAGVVAVNLVGVAVLAWLVGAASRELRWTARGPLLATGLLGSFTTFSGLVVPLAVLAADRAAFAVAWGVGSLVTGVLLADTVLRRGRP